MSGTLYLEHYLDSLEDLPSQLKQNFVTMRELDIKNRSTMIDIDTASDEYLRKVRDLSPGKRKAEMEKIQVRRFSESFFSSLTWYLIFSENVQEVERNGGRESATGDTDLRAGGQAHQKT